MAWPDSGLQTWQDARHLPDWQIPRLPAPEISARYLIDNHLFSFLSAHSSRGGAGFLTRLRVISTSELHRIDTLPPFSNRLQLNAALQHKRCYDALHKYSST